VTGGLKGAFGIAEDTSDASISCHQTGPIRFKDKIRTGEKGEEVFDERRSLLFKELHVTRFYDQASNTLVYLTWSDRIIEGSPKNSLSAVTLMTWDGQAAETPKLK
jgi:CreA protein